jgi:hypothetical protein
MTRALLQRVGRAGTRTRQALAPSPAWTLVTPYCKRTRPGRGTNTKAAGFPTLSRPSPAAFSPLRARPRADPSGLGHAATFHSSAQGPPGLETPTPRVAPTAAESSSKVAPTVARGKRRIGVPKWSVGMLGESSQGIEVPREGVAYGNGEASSMGKNAAEGRDSPDHPCTDNWATF